MFGPSPDDAPALLADIRSILTRYESEYQRALSHLDIIVKDMVATSMNRKPTRSWWQASTTLTKK